jgi:hypothetical protein
MTKNLILITETSGLSRRKAAAKSVWVEGIWPYRLFRQYMLADDDLQADS